MKVLPLYKYNQKAYVKAYRSKSYKEYMINFRNDKDQKYIAFMEAHKGGRNGVIREAIDLYMKEHNEK